MEAYQRQIHQFHDVVYNISVFISYYAFKVSTYRCNKRIKLEKSATSWDRKESARHINVLLGKQWLSTKQKWKAIFQLFNHNVPSYRFESSDQNQNMSMEGKQMLSVRSGSVCKNTKKCQYISSPQKFNPLMLFPTKIFTLTLPIRVSKWPYTHSKEWYR